jgi:hypothetical protein
LVAWKCFYLGLFLDLHLHVLPWVCQHRQRHFFTAQIALPASGKQQVASDAGTRYFLSLKTENLPICLSTSDSGDSLGLRLVCALHLRSLRMRFESFEPDWKNLRFFL